MPKTPQFNLSIHSFTPPNLPERPADAPASAFRSLLIPSAAAATSPLCFTVSLPAARDSNSLYPATHLQLSFNFEGNGEIFIPDFVTSGDLAKVDREAESNLYEVEISAHNVPRPKVNEEASSAAESLVYAWRGKRLLGKWIVGRVKGLGIAGLKSDPLAILRRDTWAAKKGGKLQMSAPRGQKMKAADNTKHTRMRFHSVKVSTIEYTVAIQTLLSLKRFGSEGCRRQ